MQNEDKCEQNLGKKNKLNTADMLQSLQYEELVA